MKSRNRILLLTLVMTLVALIVVGITIFALFLTFSNTNKRIMSSFIEHQTSLIESVLSRSSNYTPGGEPPANVLEHIRLTMDTNPFVTESGELMFAYFDGEKVHYLSEFRFAESDQLPAAFDLDDPRVGAMRNALLGETGQRIGLDYRGEEVLAVYSGVRNSNIGIVVKIDVDELRKPYLKTGAVAGVSTFIVILLGTIIFQRIGNPLVQRLEENESKYRTLFESANEGILVISDHIEECNDQVTHLLGYPKEEIIGRKIVDFTPQQQPSGNDSARLANARFELARKGEPQYFIWQSQRKDGSLMEIDVMLKAAKVGDRRLVLATFLDITDRRRAELELRRAEKEISEGREHLAHVARLSTMGEMAAGIAHEINQPLAAISTYAQGCKRMLAADGFNKEDFVEALDKIAMQAMRAGEVIRRLRSFVKKSDSGMEVVSCNQLVRDVVKLAEVDARKYDIPVLLDLADNLPLLRVDAVQIQQVILNLIRNALESMDGLPKDSVAVTVTTAMAPGGQISISVSDQGHGLDDVAMRQVFHPFFTTKPSGMGMGLSISQSIVQAHGGHLSVYNNPTAGATFVVVLKPSVVLANAKQ